MAKAVDASIRLQAITLRQAKNTYVQIAKQLGIHVQTARSICVKHNSEQKAKDAAAIATRDDILRAMTIIMQGIEKTADRISAAKLLATMQGFINPMNEPAVHVHVSGNADVSLLEAEYSALTGRKLGALQGSVAHDLPAVDIQASTTHSDALLGQPGANWTLTSAPADSNRQESAAGGGIPPSARDEDVKLSDQFFQENLKE